MNSNITLEETIPASNRNTLASYDFTCEMVGHSETPACQFVSKEKMMILPHKFFKVLAICFALVALLAIIAIIAIDTIGMGGGPVIVSFDQYFSLIEVGTGSGALAGVLKFVDTL